MSRTNYASTKALATATKVEKPPLSMGAVSNGSRPQTAQPKVPSIRTGSRRQSEANISKQGSVVGSKQGSVMGSSRSKAKLSGA